MCDFLDYFVPATTALVCGLGFCNIWIFGAEGLLSHPSIASPRTRVSIFVWPPTLDKSILVKHAGVLKAPSGLPSKGS